MNMDVTARDSAAWAALGALLKASGYTNENVCHRIGITVEAEQFLSNIGRYSLTHLEDLRRSPDPLSILCQLFLFSGQIPRNELDGLDEEVTSLLWRLGMVETVRGDSGSVRGVVQITEYNGYYFLSDKLFENLLCDFMEREDQDRLCMPPHASSLELLHALQKPGSATSFLDIGCGTGCLSILRAGGYGVVVGFDANSRCVEFSRINSILNGVNVEYQVDTWELFSRGRTFDHVSFNPPTTEAAFSFINSKLSEVLSVGGLAQIHVVLEVLAGDQSWQGVVERRIDRAEKWSIEGEVHEGSPYSFSLKSLRGGLPQDGTLLDGQAVKWVNRIKSMDSRNVSEVKCVTLNLMHS
jgi:SAM-dependent methyltransferase